MNAKRLYRSREDRMLAGVCGGLGVYLNIDPTVIRLALLLLVLFGMGTGVIVYVIAWLLVPEEPLDQANTAMTPTQKAQPAQAPAQSQPAPAPAPPVDPAPPTDEPAA